MASRVFGIILLLIFGLLLLFVGSVAISQSGSGVIFGQNFESEIGWGFVFVGTLSIVLSVVMAWRQSRN